MNYKQLGNTDLQVSEIGHGCWGIGSAAYGMTDHRESVATLKQSYQAGINFFDTADIYGEGFGETHLGETLKEVRHNIYIATKVGSVTHTGRRMPVALDDGHIRKSVDESLTRLQTDYIDIYQLHSPPVDRIHRALGIMQEIKEAGKIRYIGVSAKSPEDALVAAHDPRVDCIQINYNMIDQRARENGLFEQCQRFGVGVIARTPLAFGFLTGRFQAGTKFSIPDHRVNWSQEQIDLWAEAHHLFKQLHLNSGVTATQLALGFCLSEDAIDTTIPGMMTPLEVLENTATPHLTHSEMGIIKYIYDSHNFFIGA